MKTIKLIVSLSLIFCFISCTEDEPTNQIETIDNEGPLLRDIRWVDSPFVDGDLSGPIQDGGNYTLSIAAGFQISIDITDQNYIQEGVIYFLVNDDPTIRENIIYEGTEFGYSEGTINFVHRVDKIALGQGEFYEVKPGDTYNFYAEFEDEFGNKTSVSWSADLVM